MLGLVDCDSFYASCEVIFAPRLMGVPVVVLSSNDGNVIARSKEAKALGVAMGERQSELRERQRTHRIESFSANFALYGDISRRVMTVVGSMVPRQEIYSIDESFVDVAGVAGVEDLARAIKQRVRQWCGVPVSIGFGETKVLAKVAIEVAKKDPAAGGVFQLPLDDQARRAILGRLAVEDIWGVAEASGKRLRAIGVTTALELREADPDLVRKSLGIVGERLVWELRGQACIPLEEAPPPKQSLAVTRTFGTPLYTLEEARTVIAGFVARAAEKLRRHGLTTDHLQVFLATSPFSEREPYTCMAGQRSFATGTADTGELLAAAAALVTREFRCGPRWIKGGCLCFGLAPASEIQRTLFEDVALLERRAALLRTIDQINGKRRGFVGWGAALGASAWNPRASRRSPCYTTRWEDIPTVA